MSFMFFLASRLCRQSLYENRLHDCEGDFSFLQKCPMSGNVDMLRMIRVGSSRVKYRKALILGGLAGMVGFLRELY